MDRWWNDYDREKNEALAKKKTIPVPLCTPQIPHGLPYNPCLFSASKSVNKPCMQNTDFQNVQAGGTYSNLLCFTG